MKRSLGAVLALCLAVVGACSKKESPEARVRATIATAVQAAEANDSAGVLAIVSRRYVDADGRDRRAMEGLLRLYLLRHRPLYIYTRVPSVTFAGNDRAEAVVYAAMAGTRVDAPAELARLSATLYRFDLTFELEQDDWRLRAAAWRPAELSEFY